MAWGDPARFFQMALKYETESCINWPYGKAGNGYGVLKWRGRRINAHRAMCIEAHGDAAHDGLQAAHSCGNPSCINPSHLSWKTPSENAKDKILHGTNNDGENHGLARLRNEVARRIRVEHSLGKRQAEIAKEYALSPMTVSRLVRGLSYKGV